MVRAVVVLVMGLVLSGCGGGDGAVQSPASAPTASPSASRKTSPTPTHSAEETSRTEAISFVRHYIELINEAQATGDAGELVAASAKECKSCSAAANGIQRLYDGGGHIEGGEWTLVRVTATPNKVIRGWVVRASVRYSNQSVIYGSGKPAKSNAAGKATFTFYISHGAGRWVVVQWSRG